MVQWKSPMWFYYQGLRESPSATSNYDCHQRWPLSSFSLEGWTMIMTTIEICKHTWIVILNVIIFSSFRKDSVATFLYCSNHTPLNTRHLKPLCDLYIHYSLRVKVNYLVSTTHSRDIISVHGTTSWGVAERFQFVFVNACLSRSILEVICLYRNSNRSWIRVILKIYIITFYIVLFHA